MDEQGGPSHPGEQRGVATGPRPELTARVLGAWDALLELAAARDDLGPLAELGSWPERPVLERLLAQARARATDTAADAGRGSGPGAASGSGPGPASGGSAEAAGRPDHSGDGPQAIRAALAEARERVAAALDEAARLPGPALAPLDSPLGPLPLLTQIHAMCHELALAALRLPAGPGAPGPEAPLPVTEAGVAALVDVVGALAHRQGLRARAAVWGPGSSGWQFRADPSGWTTASCAGAAPTGVPGIEGRAAVVLGVPAGRTALPALLARGDVRLHRIGGLMALAPLVEQVPGLPGGALLRRAVGVVGLLGRLPGMR
ncbi:hypothetical protein GXW83_07695 [Streptacidiphilus sp. PB12-B1b]|uniref:hypothetical protein n=1 Tax=Streptacidiphilus sp. PB12-B1b TaxID=2705012 RepID=UPI0015FE646C|nr:hypothetical protein [Streptacidiphilus sp. PB12-B1b]QMU75636.1 hypothetical protein GXW83_07695 [Streptacidiphilus sp. PB12-B1b]